MGNAVMKPFWEMTEKDQEACLKATTWNAADQGYFRGGGYSSRFETRSEMPVTMMRLNLVKGLGPVMQIAEGYTVALPAECFGCFVEADGLYLALYLVCPASDGQGSLRIGL